MPDLGQFDDAPTISPVSYIYPKSNNLVFVGIASPGSVGSNFPVCSRPPTLK